MDFDVTVNGQLWRVVMEAAPSRDRVQVRVNGRVRTFDAAWIDGQTLSLIAVEPADASSDGAAGRGPADVARVHQFGIAESDGILRIVTEGRDFQATALPGDSARHRRAGPPAAARHARQDIASAMPGRIVRVLVSQGDPVTAGQPLAVVEAMKMENEVRAAADGVVRDVRVKPGAAIDAGEVLVVID
jgi:biotin carboxyl carrier protein